jgi:hypothetical protein
MQFIIPEHRYGALSVPGSEEERRAQARGRLARLAALDPEPIFIGWAGRKAADPACLGRVRLPHAASMKASYPASARRGMSGRCDVPRQSLNLSGMLTDLITCRL